MGNGSVQIVSPDGTPLVIDSLGAAVTMDAIHKKVHEGKMFNVFFEGLNNPLGTVVNGLVKMGSKKPHLTFDIIHWGGSIRIFMFINTQISSNGTEVIPNPYNFTTLETPITKFFLNPTITVQGSQKINRTLFSSTQLPNITTTVLRQGVERIFIPNTNVIIGFQTLDAGVSVQMVADFYET